MSVADNYRKLIDHVHEIAKKCSREPAEITVVSVSKKHPWKHIEPAYIASCRDFGESYVQEALTKITQAPNDINWHLIGNLQKNKVCKVIGKFSLIHSVDSVALAERISQCSQEQGSITRILLEVNTSNEESKHGLTPDSWKHSFEYIRDLPNIRIEGLMTMAPFVDDENEIRICFQKLKKLNEFFGLKELSMGMTNDYHLAIEEGATILRIGTAIFGERSS